MISAEIHDIGIDPAFMPELKGIANREFFEQRDKCGEPLLVPIERRRELPKDDLELFA